MTITELEKELEVIRKGAAKGKYQEYAFGIKECKRFIQWEIDFLKKPLKEIYASLIVRGLNEPLFNIIMIVACEEMMKEVGA